MKITYLIENIEENFKLEIPINFKKNDLFAIQAKNGTCKTNFYNLIKNFILSEESESLKIGKNEFSLYFDSKEKEMNLKNFNVIFYSYLDELKNNNQKELMSVLQDKEISKYLLFEEFLQLKKSKESKNFLELFKKIFTFDIGELENINIIFNMKESNIEVFIYNLFELISWISKSQDNTKVFSFLLDSNFFAYYQNDDLNIINFLNNFHNKLNSYNDKIIIEKKNYLYAKESISKYSEPIIYQFS